MHPRAIELISLLGLTPHPEGGRFRQVYLSASHVQPADDRPARAALTTIYFLLAAGEWSRWHRVASDEAWHYYEGDALELFTFGRSSDRVERHRLGAPDRETQAVSVVPANVWQAARTTGAYTLVGCTVAPGFDYGDFQMLRDVPDDAELLKPRLGELATLI